MNDFNNCRLMHYPAEVLAGAAKPVEQIDDGIGVLVEKMTDIMLEHKGIGLAGPQAGVGLRIFIISLDGSREGVRVYINPTVTPIAEELEPNEEGCLSVPGVYTKVRRYTECRVKATDLSGKDFSEEAEGLYARVLQHEYDHIEGLTIVNRMSPTAKIAHRRQLKKLRTKQDS